MAGRSFISDLKYVESAVRRGEVSERGGYVFRRLTGFIESGSFTKSKNMKFLCRYWSSSYGELGRIWASQGYREKSQETFRVQMSNLGKMLRSLFPTFSRELFVSGTVLEKDEADFAAIETAVDALQGCMGLPEEVFIAEAVRYAGDACCDGEVSVGECRGTVEKLKPLMQSEVLKYLGGLDICQLKFIFSVLRRPLFGVRATACDTEKLELMKMFGAVGTAAADAETAAEAVKRDKPAKVLVEAAEKTPYNLSFSKSLSDILTQRGNDRLTDEETREWLAMPEAEKDKYRRRLANFLSVFTEEGFRRQMAHYNPLALGEVLDGGYPVKEGEERYQFRKQEGAI